MVHKNTFAEEPEGFLETVPTDRKKLSSPKLASSDMVIPEEWQGDQTVMIYNGWQLPNPPSLVVNKRDPPGIHYSAGTSNSVDMLRDSKLMRNETANVERKPSSKKQKKKNKINGDKESHQSTTFAVTEDGTWCLRRSNSNSSRTSSRSSSRSPLQSSWSLPSNLPVEDNSTSSFQPRFSKSRYIEQQDFGALASYYSPRDDSQHETVATKTKLSLKGLAERKVGEAKQKHVQFAQPLVSSINYRLKTAAEDIDSLFFQEDELLDWEEDRETTSSERFEMTLSTAEHRVSIASEIPSISSEDSYI